MLKALHWYTKQKLFITPRSMPKLQSPTIREEAAPSALILPADKDPPVVITPNLFPTFGTQESVATSPANHSPALLAPPVKTIPNR